MGTDSTGQDAMAAAEQMTNLRAPTGGPKAVGSLVPRVTRKAFEKFGFGAAELVSQWRSVVGADLAAFTAPERLRWPRPAAAGKGEAGDEAASLGRPAATLLLRVDGPRALEVQLKARQIIERINAYFGYTAVAELRIVQGALARPSPGARPKDVLAVGRATALPSCDTLSALAANVPDADLKAALERLGRGVAADRRRG